MGYISKDIAVITEPKIVTLAAAPNFVQFASKPSTKAYYEANVQVNVVPATPDLETKSIIRITEPSGVVHAFHGTTIAADVGGSVFYVAADTSDTAENLRQVMLANKWIAANLEIVLPSTWVGADVSNGKVLNIKSKGAGNAFDITITAPNNTSNVAYTITIVQATSTNNDSISGEESTVQIDLDVFEGSDIFLGQDDRPITPAKIGSFAATLSKTYAGVPLWFELNALFSQYGKYNKPPTAAGWFDTGTIQTYRFAAKVRGTNSFTFYQSNALFVINGYGYPSEVLDLEDYIYNANSIKLLTNKPRTTYVKGQRAFLNFLLRDPFHSTGGTTYSLRVSYRAYEAGGAYLGTIYNHTVANTALQMVNSCVLDIDAVLAAYPLAGIVKIALARGTTLVSNDLEYLIRPDGLHDLTQFIFLNRLGGWDAVNFDNTPREEVKPYLETFNKTITPSFSKGDSIETVYSAGINAPITVEGAPVDDRTAQWLKELGAARVLFDGAGNYIIKEDFTLNISEGTQDMQTPTIRYRLTETYTND